MPIDWPKLGTRIKNFFKKVFEVMRNQYTLKAIGWFALVVYLGKFLVPSVRNSNFLDLVKAGGVAKVFKTMFHYYFITKEEKTMLCTSAFGLINKKTLLNDLTSKNIAFDFDYFDINFATHAAACIAMLTSTFDILKKNKLGNNSINFSKIGGNVEAKKEFTKIVDILKNPAKYKDNGVKLPKGVLLYGPPGTGKTLTAKALANEANINFEYVSGSEFVEIYVGVGPKRVRELFQRAREKAPTIIFIDEIDALGFSRSEYSSSGGLRETDMTLGQLLGELDGFKEDDNIIVVGSTNQEQLLDSALIRSGRMDLKIEFKLPSKEERKEILLILLKSRIHKLTETCIASFLEESEGLTGADIESIVNQAGIASISKCGYINDEMFNESFTATKNELMKFQSIHAQKKDWSFKNIFNERLSKV